MTGLVLRISTVEPLPPQVIAAGCRDAEVLLRDQQRAPERVHRVVPVDDVGEAVAWLLARGPAYGAAGRRFAIVPASAVAS